ncbi:phosphoadenosine phosphosulfate reductase [Algirhabdus cladophorae]|uniref:phosphoadenosine phosphosulfate reductase n=1 Tax=Algirhabdus cladophorae TaxID=3377108 RepID=UPI003B8454DD
MRDEENVFGVQLGDLSKEDWLDQLEDFALDHGFFEPLGPLHSAVHIEGSDTLLVTFESIENTRARSESGEPLGFELVRMTGCSHLGLISDGDTWFRSDRVYAFFDKLTDDGFFDQYEQIVFYGYAMAGYAAAAFSVAAPGAQVVVIQPQASLDPRVAGWDRRYLEMRRTSFTDRYGYAPDMLDACHHAFVIYDTERERDAMHASLFKKKNVSLIRCPHLGGDIENEMMKMDILHRILAKSGKGKLSDQALFRILRARRLHTPYLRRLLLHVHEQNKPKLTAALCRYILKDKNLPQVRRILQQVQG